MCVFLFVCLFVLVLVLGFGFTGKYRRAFVRPIPCQQHGWKQQCLSTPSAGQLQRCRRHEAGVPES